MFHDDDIDPLISLILFASVGIFILVRLAVHLTAKSCLRRIYFHLAAIFALICAFPYSWQTYNCSECTEWRFITTIYLFSTCLQYLCALHALSAWYAILQSSKDDEDVVQQAITRWNGIAFTCAALISTWSSIAVAYVLILQDSVDDKDLFWSSTVFCGYRWSNCSTIVLLVLILFASMLSAYNRSNDPAMQQQRQDKIQWLFVAILVLVAGYVMLFLSDKFISTVLILFSSVFMLRGIARPKNKTRTSSQESDETVMADRSDSGVFRAIGGRTRHGSYFIDRSSFNNPEPLGSFVSSTTSSVAGLFAIDSGESDEDNSAIVLPSGRVTVLNEHASSQPEAFRAYNYLSSATSSVASSSSAASLNNSSRKLHSSFATGQVEVL